MLGWIVPSSVICRAVHVRVRYLMIGMWTSSVQKTFVFGREVPDDLPRVARVEVGRFSRRDGSVVGIVAVPQNIRHVLAAHSRIGLVDNEPVFGAVNVCELADMIRISLEVFRRNFLEEQVNA